jgi:hypothetical protein
MFYTFDVYGLYTGTSETEVAYSTGVAPPDENVTAKWVWNHVNWVGLPLDWKYAEVEYVATPVVVTPVVKTLVETPAEPTA